LPSLSWRKLLTDITTFRFVNLLNPNRKVTRILSLIRSISKISSVSYQPLLTSFQILRFLLPCARFKVESCVWHKSRTFLLYACMILPLVDSLLETIAKMHRIFLCSAFQPEVLYLRHKKSRVQIGRFQKKYQQLLVFKVCELSSLPSKDHLCPQ
jgi:hypothetical protein